VDPITLDSIRALPATPEPPCVSIYQPTHRHHPDNQQDPIRFRNLVKQVDESLRQKYGNRQIRPLIERLETLAANHAFWNKTLDGLVVLTSADGFFQVMPLQLAVSERVVVAESFHLKPLMQATLSSERFQVLGLSRKAIRLWEGHRFALDPIDLSDDFPSTIEKALGSELTEPHRTVASYGMGVAGPAMVHGHGGRREEEDKDAERFFRVVDHAVTERISKPSGLPLIPLALAENHPIFRSVAKNPYLTEVGIHGNPDGMSEDQIRAAVWEAFEPERLARLAEVVNSFRTAQSRQHATSDLSDAARAAVASQISTLLVEVDRVIPGRLDPTSGAIETGELYDPEVDDLLDDLAEVVLRHGGRVIALPANLMPTTTGLAAIMRF